MSDTPTSAHWRSGRIEALARAGAAIGAVRKATLHLRAGETAWNPHQPTRPFAGPAVVEYLFWPGGDCIALITCERTFA